MAGTSELKVPWALQALLISSSHMDKYVLCDSPSSSCFQISLQVQKVHFLTLFLAAMGGISPYMSVM